MNERRKFVRLDARVKVEYKVVESEQGLESFTKNVSEGGICLFLDSFVNKDTILNLNLFLPDSPKALELSGKVVWIDRFQIGDSQSAEEHYEAGVEFTNISKEQRDRISHYVFQAMGNSKG